MFPYLTIGQTCVSCDLCAVICPEGAIVANGKDYFVDTWSCTLCQICIEVCPVDCIKISENEN